MLTACGAGKNSKEEATLAEARKIHNEAIKIHNEVMKDLKNLAQLKVSLQDSLTKKTDLPLQKQIDACEAQQTAMKEWMANIQEVPSKDGEAHDHHDHEGHNHDHKPAPQVSADDMLAYQKEMKKNIEKIQQEVKNLLKK